MRRPGFEPGFWAWKAQVIATRPSTQTATHQEVFFIYILFGRVAPRKYAPNCASGVRPELRLGSTPRIAPREYAVRFAHFVRSSGLILGQEYIFNSLRRDDFSRISLRVMKQASSTGGRCDYTTAGNGFRNIQLYSIYLVYILILYK